MATTDPISVYNPNWQDYQLPDWLKNTKRYGDQSMYGYDPFANGTNPSDANAYSGTESSAIARLNDIIKNGGYSPQQKQTMLAGAMAPVQEAADVAKQKTQADAYARGVGQSSVLSKGYGEIDKSVISQLAQLAGGIEQQGAAQVLPAIQATQSGELAKENMAYQKAQLKAQLHMSDQDYDSAIAGINAGLDKSDADRALQYQNIRTQYNLSQAQLDLLVQQAQNEQKVQQDTIDNGWWRELLKGLPSAAATVAAAL